MGIGSRIKAAMAIKKISNAELARQIGISRSSVGEWILKDNIPNADNLVKLGDILGVSIENLLREDSGASSVIL